MQNHARFAGLLAIVLCVAGPPLRAEDEVSTTTTTSPPAVAAVKVTTEVQGTVPKDLVGRWIAVSQVKLMSGQVRPIPRTFEIRQGAEHLEVSAASEPGGTVAPKINAAAASGQTWTPTEEDLRTIDQGWKPIEPDPKSYAALEYKIIGADAYPPEFQNDETTKGSQFAITFRETYAGQQAVRNSYSVYAIRDRTKNELKGTSLLTTLAVAFVPMPITLKGDFQAYRVGAAAETSFFERLSSFFSGCGKR